MGVTEHEFARIPPRNLRVPREEFVAVWAAADLQAGEQAARGVTDWYAGGVVATCKWLAGATVRTSDGVQFPAHAPATCTDRAAYEELIEAEYLAAELLADRQPGLATARPGWCEAICATLRWAWRQSGPAPLNVATPTDRVVG